MPVKYHNIKYALERAFRVQLQSLRTKFPLVFVGVKRDENKTQTNLLQSSFYMFTNMFYLFKGLLTYLSFKTREVMIHELILLSHSFPGFGRPRNVVIP